MLSAVHTCSFWNRGKQFGLTSSRMGFSPLKEPMYTLHTCADAAALLHYTEDVPH